MLKDLNKIVALMEANARSRMAILEKYERNTISFDQFLLECERLDMMLLLAQNDYNPQGICNIHEADLICWDILSMTEYQLN